MAHPKLQLSRLLDLIKESIDHGDAPTDDQIVAFLGLDSEQTARSMLADLADRGDITMRGVGGMRQIALGRQHRTIETPRPVPSVVKPAKPLLSEEECVRRIQMIASRLQTPKPVSPAAAMEVPASGEGERQGDTITTATKATTTPEAAPPSFEPKRLPTAPKARVVYDVVAARQVNVRLDQVAFDEIKRRANGRSVTGTATSILQAALRGDPAGPTPLFRIPAEVTRAAIKHGMPVLDFAATLMMRGLGSFEQDAAREIAA